MFILVINQIDTQNLFHNKFISYLYMFRAPCAHRQEVKIVLYSLGHHHTYNKFISCLYMFRAPCAHRQEAKIVLYSLWYHHTETSEWSKITKITKITKIQFYNYEHIVVKLYSSNFSYFSNFRPLTCFSVMIPETV